MPYEQLEQTFATARELGVKVVISELDIDVMNRSKWWAENNKYREELKTFDPYKDGLPAEVAQQQAEAYGRLFDIFERNSDVIARVSFWNLHDGESWLNYFPWDRTNHPLLFDRQMEPKPAFAAVIKALQE